MKKLAVLALLAPLAFAQDAPAPIEHTEIADGIYMLHTVGGVGLLVGDDYVVLDRRFADHGPATRSSPRPKNLPAGLSTSSSTRTFTATTSALIERWPRPGR